VPKQLRYGNVEEAASLIESSLFDWSPKRAGEYIKVSDRFSQEKFCNEFLRIMAL